MPILKPFSKSSDEEASERYIDGILIAAVRRKLRAAASGKEKHMILISKILCGVLFGLCIWYILLLYKNNRNKL